MSNISSNLDFGKLDDGGEASAATDAASSTPSKGVDLDMDDTIKNPYCRARDGYRRNLRTLNEINLPILDNVFTKTSSNIATYSGANSGSSYPLLYTPVYGDWVDAVHIGDGMYKTEEEKHAEADYWTDPRFNSNCFRMMSGGGLEYMVYRKETDHLWIASKVGSIAWMDLVDIGPCAKRVIILAVGAGGGGAGGVHFTGPAGYTCPCFSSGAGGGAGAGAMVVANVGAIARSSYPYKSECLLISIGKGGSGGQCAQGGDPSGIQETVWGGNGGDTSLSLYIGGSLKDSVTCGGGKGGGNGTKCHVRMAGKDIDYPMPFGPGAGGEVSGGSTSYFWFVYTGLSNPGYFSFDGADGGESRYYTTVSPSGASYTIFKGNGKGSEKDGGVVGAAYGLLKGKAYKPSGLFTTAVSYYAPERSAGKTTSGHETLSGDDVYHIGGGGASVLGNGGGYGSDYKYDATTNLVTYNVAEAALGGGGCGGICHGSNSRTQTTSGYPGADGCALMWWPDPLRSTTASWQEFKSAPSLSQTQSSGKYSCVIANGNFFDTYVRYSVARGSEAAAALAAPMQGEENIAANGVCSIEDLYPGDIVTALFFSGVNASESASLLISSPK